MPSTVIRKFGYDPATCELHVEFTTGRRYVYLDVPQEIADAFRSAFAKGIFFNRHVRNRYVCREITREAHAAKG